MHNEKRQNWPKIRHLPLRVMIFRKRYFTYSDSSRKAPRFGWLHGKIYFLAPGSRLFLPDGGESREPSANIIDTIDSVLTVLSIQRGESILYSSKWTRSLARSLLRYHPLARRATPFAARSHSGGCQEHQGLYIAPPALSAHRRAQIRLTRRIASSVGLCEPSSTCTKSGACEGGRFEQKFICQHLANNIELI